MDKSAEAKSTAANGDGELTCISSTNDGKLCMDTSSEETTMPDGSPAAMAPVTPLHRKFSSSERNLSVPDDAPEDVEGFCNEAYEGDPIRHGLPGLSKSFPSTPIKRREEKTQVDEASEPEKGQFEKEPSYSSDAPDQSLVPQKQNDIDQSHLSSLSDIGSSPYRNASDNLNGSTPLRKENGHTLGPTDSESPVDASYTPSIVESRKGTYSDSGTIPAGMLHEGIPIIEERGILGGKTIEKSNYNGGMTEKVGYATQEDDSRWKVMKMGVHNLSRPIMRKHNPLPADPTKGDRMKYAFLCPPHGKVGRILTYLLFFLLFWGSLIYITHEEALPGGNLFSLLFLVIVAQLGGMLVVKVRLPPLLGMLLVGIMFRSVSGLSVIGDSIKPEWSSSLRSVALVVILTRAGLGLDPEALRKLSFVVLRLAMMPCLVEATVVAVVSHLLLEFPWKWGFMLGFVLAAVSPAVVVPCLLSLNEQGYGVEKGIPTLVIAAASIDDVIAISGFGVCLGMIFSQDDSSPVWQGLKGPFEFAMGIGYGIVVGIILWALPHKREEDAILHRFILLFGAGLLAVFGSKGIEFGGAGALGCLCVAFVAGYGWRKQGKIGPNKTQVNEYFNLMWMFFQPMLFGLIGTEIRISELDMDTVGWGVMTLAVGLTFRVFVSFFSVMGGGLNLKERFFVALAWLPKATVQAAIGSTALDYARDNDSTPDQVDTTREIMGMKVLTIAVLVILITAPIGAVAIMLSAPKLLEKAPSKEEKKAKRDVES